MSTKDVDRYIDRPFNIRPMCMWAFFVFITVLVCLWSNTAGVWVVAVWFAVLFIGFFASQYVRGDDKVLRFLGAER